MKFIVPLAIFSGSYYFFSIADGQFYVAGASSFLTTAADFLNLTVAALLTSLYFIKSPVDPADGYIKKISALMASSPVLIPLIIVLAALAFSAFTGGFEIVLNHILTKIISSSYVLTIITYRIPELILLYFLLRFSLQKSIRQGNGRPN